MKKFFLFAAAVVAAMTVNAANAVWDFATWPETAGYTNQVKDNLGLYACSPSATTQITNFGQTEASAKTFRDEYAGVNRFKLNGAGFASDPGFSATPTQRFVYFNVTAASNIKIWFRGGGSGDRIPPKDAPAGSSATRTRSPRPDAAGIRRA